MYTSIHIYIHIHMRMNMHVSIYIPHAAEIERKKTGIIDKTNLDFLKQYFHGQVMVAPCECFCVFVCKFTL